MYFRIKNSIFITLILFISVTKSFSQSNTNLEVSNDGYCTFIQPSLNNICRILFMSNSEFVQIMSRNNYIETASGIGFMAKATKPSHFRIIKKDSRSVYMNFAPNNIDLVTNFRRDLRKAVQKDLNVEYENGYETYRIRIPHDGINYNVMFKLKDESINDNYMGSSISYTNGTIIALIN